LLLLQKDQFLLHHKLMQQLLSLSIHHQNHDVLMMLANYILEWNHHYNLLLKMQQPWLVGLMLFSSDYQKWLLGNHQCPT
jgi:hypothetical protein